MNNIIHKNDNYKFIGILGAGSYAKVYWCISSEGIPVAIKNIYLEYETINISTLSELNALSVLQGKPHIIKLIDVKINDFKSIDIILQQCSGNLLQFINIINKAERIKVFDKIINQLLEGLYYIHKQNIIHRDIKPSNILIDFHYDYTIKKLLYNPMCYYADFGLALQLPSNKISYDDKLTDVYTSGYKAPEILNKNTKYVYEPDVWALGITLLNYLTNDIYLEAENDIRELHNIYSMSNKSGIDVISILNKHSINICNYHINLIKKMLLLNMNNRLKLSKLNKYTKQYLSINKLPSRGNILSKDIDLDYYYFKIDQLISIAIIYNLSIVSIIISIDLFERYLANYHVNISNIDKIYAGCLLIGSKSEDDMLIDIKDFEDAYGKDINKYELLILKKMNYMYISNDIKIMIDKIRKTNNPYMALKEMYFLLQETAIYPGNCSYKYLSKYIKNI